MVGTPNFYFPPFVKSAGSCHGRRATMVSVLRKRVLVVSTAVSAAFRGGLVMPATAGAAHFQTANSVQVGPQPPAGQA